MYDLIQYMQYARVERVRKRELAAVVLPVYQTCLKVLFSKRLAAKHYREHCVRSFNEALWRTRTDLMKDKMSFLHQKSFIQAALLLMFL